MADGSYQVASFLFSICCWLGCFSSFVLFFLVGVYSSVKWLSTQIEAQGKK